MFLCDFMNKIKIIVGDGNKNQNYYIRTKNKNKNYYFKNYKFN